MTTTEKCATGHCVGKWTALTLVIILALAVVGWATLEQRKNILKTAEGLDGCATFVECVQKAGLAGVLEKDGPFSVFIPTDDAFGKIDQKQLTQLLDNKSALTALLLYHLVPKKMNSDEMENMKDCMTCTVPQSAIPCSQHTYGKANLIRSALPCTNGVIYLIDTVQIPPFMAGDGGMIEEAELTVVEEVSPDNSTSENSTPEASKSKESAADKRADKKAEREEKKIEKEEKKIEKKIDREKEEAERVGEKFEKRIDKAEDELKKEVEKAENIVEPKQESPEQNP